MKQLTAQQANDLAGNFLGLAQAIGEFRFTNWQVLTPEENRQLGNLQWSIMNYGEDILAFSTTLVMDDAQEALARIDDITSRIKGTIQNLQKIQKGIDVAASVVTLGAAIISKNPLAILDALSNVEEVWNG